MTPEKKVHPVFDHLAVLTDGRSVFEHALRTLPHRQLGYRLDDAARALVVTSREPQPSPRIVRLHGVYLEFVLDALGPDGACYRRMGPDGTWLDRRGIGGWWGDAVWALGVAAAQSPTAGQRARALTGFRIAAQGRSTSSRSMAFAVLGAGAVLQERPGEPAARALLRDAVRIVALSPVERDLPWQKPPLRYAGATVAEALLVAGEAFSSRALQQRGAELLTFLLRVDLHYPIEVGAIADACASAYRITGDPRWLAGINRAWRWFHGENDAGKPMFDAVSGGGYDALTSDGRDKDQGAESTLAVLSTAQHARDVQRLR
jgi:hypothetical protein